MSHFYIVTSQPLAIMSSKFEQMDQYSPHSCDSKGNSMVNNLTLMVNVEKNAVLK